MQVPSPVVTVGKCSAKHEECCAGPQPCSGSRRMAVQVLSLVVTEGV